MGHIHLNAIYQKWCPSNCSANFYNLPTLSAVEFLVNLEKI